MIETIHPQMSVFFLPRLPTSLTLSFPVAKLPTTISVPRFRVLTVVQMVATFPAVDTRLSIVNLNRRTSSRTSTSTSLSNNTSNKISWLLSHHTSSVKLAITRMILLPVSHDNSRTRTWEHLSAKGVPSLVNNLRVQDYFQVGNKIKVNRVVTSTAMRPTSQITRPRCRLPCRITAFQEGHSTLPTLRNSHQKRILKDILLML